MPGVSRERGFSRIPGTQNAYASPPFREGGVSCERCHGEGSDHIATGKPMLNPAKLAATERDSICEQCHLSGEIRVAKSGKDDLAFRPGHRLADDLTVFVRSGSPSPLKVTSHAEDLAQSACKRASGEKLWCGTCHDPHSVPAADEKAAYFRGKCLSCHQTSDCRAPQSTRLANGDNCVTCHMPRNPPSDVEHVVFTDHAIRRRARPPGGSLPADADLVPFGGGAASTRDLGLAYAMVGLREQNPTYVERAFHLLQETVAERARRRADTRLSGRVLPRPQRRCGRTSVVRASLADGYNSIRRRGSARRIPDAAWQLRTGHPLLGPGSGHQSSAGSGAHQSCRCAAAHRARRASSGDVATGLGIPTVVSGGQRSTEPDHEIN